MQDQRSCIPPKEVSADREDQIIQSALLANVIAQHPTQLTVLELVTEMAADPEDFGRRDAIERAIRDLAGAGLLHRHGPFVLPSRAALLSDELWSNA
jgi:hypothetical protein